MPRSLWWVLAGGLLIRVLAAACGGVYVDEAYAFFISRSTFPAIIAGARPDLNPPAYYFLLHPLSLLSRSPLLLRLPAVLFATAALYCIYQVGVRLHSHSAGLATAGLTAVSYACWITDTQMRAYGLLAFLSALLLWQFVATREDGVPPGGWALYYAACVAAASCHYLGTVLVGVLLLASLLPGPERRQLAGGAAAGLACSALWLWYSLSGATNTFRRHAEWQIPYDFLQTPGYLVGLWGPAFWAANKTSIPTAVLGNPWPLDLLLWMMAGWGWLGLMRRSRQHATLLAMAWLLPMLALTICGAIGIQPYQHRYLSTFAWIFFLPLVVGLLSLQPLLAGRKVALGGLVLGVMAAVNLLAAALFPFQPYFWNQDWPSTVRWIEAREKPGDTIVVYVGYSLIGFDFYYHPGQIEPDYSHSGTIAFSFSPTYSGSRQIGLYPSMLNADLQKALSSRVFLVLNQEDETGGQAVRQWFSARYGFVDQFHQDCLNSWGRTTVYLLAPR